MVKRNSFNHTVKFIGFKQSALLSGHGFTLKQFCPAAVFVNPIAEVLWL